MPKRKSINIPPKRKRRSTDAPAGPAPFGTRETAKVRSGVGTAAHSDGIGPTRPLKRRRPSGVRESYSVDLSSGSEEDNGTSRKRRQKGESSEEERASIEGNDEVSEHDELSRTKFAILRPRQRSVKQSIVKNKWESLGEKSQERIRTLFDGLERPLIAVHQGEKRRMEAQAALSQLMRILHRRLPRMPFPKDTKEWHFDQEALMASNRTLETSTTSQQHAITLLKTEIREQEAGLDADEQELRELEKNAKKEARHRQQHSGKRHPLLADISTSPPSDSAISIRLVSSASSQETASKTRSLELSSDLDTSLDPHLAPLVKQLNNHLESLEGNAGQAAGLEAFMTRAATQLDALLSSRVAKDLYEQLPNAV